MEIIVATIVSIVGVDVALIYSGRYGTFHTRLMFPALPEVQTFDITPDWEFIVLACDGIWDVMSNAEVVSIVRQRIASGIEPEEICENIMMLCLAPDCQMAGLGCDNMTVVIVGLLQGGTYEQLSQKCARTSNSNEFVDVPATM